MDKLNGKLGTRFRGGRSAVYSTYVCIKIFNTNIILGGKKFA
jgi:hypothetical protein